MQTEMLNELVVGIVDIMRPLISHIVLYESVARNTNTQESDVDIAILVKEKSDAQIEDRLTDFIVDMNLKYDTIFSVIDIKIDKFDERKKYIPFYKNVSKEGVVLWKAA